MATHSGLLAWRIPWTQEPGGLQSTGSQSQDTTEATDRAGVHTLLPCPWATRPRGARHSPRNKTDLAGKNGLLGHDLITPGVGRSVFHTRSGV